VNSRARPYAEALFGIARDRGCAPDVLRELAAIDAAIPDEARVLLAHPGVRPDAAAAMLESIVRSASPLVANFLRLLAEKRRFALLPDIVEALRARLDEAEGRLRARLQTARPAGDADVAALASALGRRFGREVEVTAEVRPELIGGARVVVGDKVLDGSLQGHLAALRRRLLAARN
jgi:F-type H+-transporting ATPase subunit delta